MKSRKNGNEFEIADIISYQIESFTVCFAFIVAYSLRP